MLSKSGRGAAVLRGVAVLAVILVWLGLAGAGGMSIGKLSDVQENDVASFLPEGAESTEAAAAAAEFRDDAVLPALVVVRGEGALTPEQLGTVQAFAEEIPTLELDGGTTVDDLLVAPPVAIPSEDGEAALLTVALDADAANEQIGEERAVNLVVEELRTAVDESLEGEGLEAWVTGPAGAIADLVAAFGGIDGLLLVVALAVVFVILVLVYRSPLLPFTVLFTSLFGLSAAALVVYQLAAADVLVLNGQSQGILFILVVGAATDYSLLVVARYREELRRAESPFTAMRRAVRASIEPIAASAGTVIAGLLCLLLSDLRSNQSLGPVAAIGIAAAFLASMTLLPALLLVGGRRARVVFWPRMPRVEADAADGAAESLEHLESRSGLWGRVSRLIGRHPRRVWLATAAVLAVACVWVPTFEAEGTGESDIFLTEVESVAGEEVLAEHFDAGQVQPVTVVVTEGDLDAVLDAVGQVDGVAAAAPVTEGAGGGRPADPSAPPVVVDGRVLVEVVTEASSESQEATVVVEDLRSAAHEASSGALVGGAAAERLDTQVTSARDLRVIVPTILAVILVVLVLLLRAVVAPVLLILANLLSFGATVGIAALVFNHVLDMPGADASVPLYAFVFLVALGIDYSIFLMTRVREESLAHGTREGVRRGLTVTGGVITSAGVVLAATFGALAVLPLLFLVQLAFLVALGVLIDALVVRTLLVPGLVHDLGAASWWPWHKKIGS
ncbi:MMPL family transporter [Actinotalea ferrariae]|uniref:MMPL family transporter n=1 Tax=Actinotalea ferrariae TaxID=1386098 RepID=UPI001C8BFE46|nr:MMPL family transporter [Actinotalea ferrariae]MBX9246166.1 MMPL family transporter [Actinotalea ferrariae]